MSDELVTNTLEYAGKKLTVSVQRVKEKPELLLWYIQIDVEGFKKPFQSKILNSIFARDLYAEASKLEDANEYLKMLFTGAEPHKTTKCELLTVNLDNIELMWYCDGQVQIETDSSLLRMMKDLLNKLEAKDPTTLDMLERNGYT